MSQEPRLRPSHTGNGFTLLEVMVSLLVGTLIVGGIMGVISASLQFNLRLSEKSSIQPVLEAAAQEILADPRKAESGELMLDALPGTPVVGIQTTPVDLGGGTRAGGRARALYRVQLLYRGEQLEFSLVIPQGESR